MKFLKPITDVIKMRTSCRTYDTRGIEEEIIQKLNKYIEEINLESKDKARFIIINLIIQLKNSVHMELFLG
ncbi:nitroreductase family protein [Sedimentibacter sp. MB31-C6]|uniref:nitroreductase family protein n=1 Tax=Sedimentibacter sp. MB31-C6 TaxID=3109366 RepID=UPI002DDDA9D8|nr:nitroreductase family protein [Sedimentibacter sp. MB36-C1]WSI03669.1 nitroreductase family protein [Sedimentibacter sp. MB36-C1]